MAKAIKDLKQLKILKFGKHLHFIFKKLGGNSIGTEGAKALGLALRELKLLTSLDIGNLLI